MPTLTSFNMAKNSKDTQQAKPQDKGIKAPQIPRVSIPKIGKKSSWRGFVIYAILGVLLFAFLTLTTNPAERFAQEKPLSEVISDIKEGKVEKIEVDGDKLNVGLKDTGQYVARKEEGQSFFSALEAAQVDPTKTTITVKDRTFSQVWVTILTTFLPLILIAAFFLFIFRQAREGASSIFSFGQSRARQFTRDMSKVTFKDVAGVDEAKQELQEVVDFLKHPQKYRAIGARTPKGVLLVGPAGTGKTLLARAVAGEAEAPFYSVAGSEFMEMLVGVGAARVRDLFAQAKKSAPAIVFIDEVESIGRMRGLGFSGGHDEREQTLNQILVEMDGFTPNDNVIVLAATNRGDLLDPALLRPGRFDRRVVVDMPDIEGRKAILGIYAKNKPFAGEVNWEAVAKRTVGFSGADLENMLNEAAITAAREDKRLIEMKDIEEAATKVKLGPQKKRLQSEEDRKMTAYHEMGHAIVSWAQPGMDPVHRISIVSRGMTLGHTLIPPAADRVHETKKRLVAQIATMLGGRAAEEMVFSEVTTGAANDIDKVTKVARDMVTEYGMSELGPVNYGPMQDAVDWGRAYFEQPAISPDMQAKIDAEVKRIVDEGYKTAVKILKKYRKKLDEVSKRLLVIETMDGDEFEKIMKA